MIPSEANEYNDYTANGIKYDPQEYAVKVDVVEKSGILTASTTIWDKNASNIELDSMYFNNTLSLSATLNIELICELVGREVTNDDEFRFELRIPEIGNEPGTTRNIIFNRGGSPLNEIVFSEESIGKHYMFFISQLRGAAQDISYDYSDFRIDVDVVKDGSNGILELSGNVYQKKMGEDDSAYTQTGTIHFDQDKYIAEVRFTNSHLPTPTANTTYLDVLGYPTVRYGIVANSLDQSAHIESNFAVRTYKPNGNDMGDLRIKTANKPSTYIGTITGTTTVNMASDANGLDIYTLYGESDKFIVDNESLIKKKNIEEYVLDRYLDHMLDNARWISTQLFEYDEQLDASEIIDTTSDPGKTVIDITGKGSGTIYIKFYNVSFPGDDLTIKMNSDQNIVFNIDGRYSDVMIRRYTCDIGGTAYKSEEATSTSQYGECNETLTRKIIFNCRNADNVDISLSTGVFIAPGANVRISGTSSGWLIADTVNVVGGEWHYIYKDL